MLASAVTYWAREMISSTANFTHWWNSNIIMLNAFFLFPAMKSLASAVS